MILSPLTSAEQDAIRRPASGNVTHICDLHFNGKTVRAPRIERTGAHGLVLPYAGRDRCIAPDLPKGGRRCDRELSINE